MTCKICGNSVDNSIFIVREMMLGLREEFKYMLCSKCECLQICSPPKNLEKYYPDNYYSFSKAVKQESKLKRYLTKHRDRFAIEKGKNYLGKIINSIKPANSFINILSETHITRKSSILDVGTGQGLRLLPLVNAGYNVVGIDPFISKKVKSINGLRIFRQDILNIEGQWDLIMFNHVFEHLPDPEMVIVKTNKLLSPSGKCLIRIPIIPSYAWDNYKTDWAQIDAPRHFFIHSIKSMELLADRAQLQIEKIIYDSRPFQFLGSELYRRNISMKDGDFRLDKNNRLFTTDEISFFIQKAKELNMTQKGDQVALILRKLDKKD